MNADKMATVVGGVLAALSAAPTALSQVQPGTSMHGQDWINLAMACAFGFMGWITNKQKQG